MNNTMICLSGFSLSIHVNYLIMAAISSEMASKQVLPLNEKRRDD